MQYRFKIIHEHEDPIFTEWRDDVTQGTSTGISTPRIPHLLELHGQYPLASIATEFQGGPPDSAQYAWLDCPFKDKETSDKFAEIAEGAGFKTRRRDGVCIAVGGASSRLDEMKKLVHSSIGSLAKDG